MKIGIDISQIVYGTGVSKYTRNLVDALLRIDKVNEYSLFGGTLRRKNDLIKIHKQFPGNSILKAFPLSPLMADFLWNKIHMFPIESVIGNVDVFHSSDWTQPPIRGAKKVTTIHDLVPILYPHESHPEIVSAHKKRLEWVKKEVDVVIAVSEATKKDIVEHIGIPEERIIVVYEAPDSSIKKVDKNVLDSVRKKYGLPEEYFLAVGANTRKNIKRILQAVDSVKNSLPLVVIGRQESDVGNSKNIIWPGYIDNDEEFAAVLTGASALVYASLYEGFGLPILDAFLCEVPVVTSNISSMPEIAGSAAVLVDPKEVDDIARGIKEAMNKKSQLVKKGKARVKQFSWGKAARETLEVYEEVVR